MPIMTGGTVFWDVDTQVDFMLPSGSLAVPGAECLLPNLGRLTTAARAAGITIVHTADDHEPHDPEIADTPDFVETFPPHCLRGTPGAQRWPRRRPHPARQTSRPTGWASTSPPSPPPPRWCCARTASTPSPTRPPPHCSGRWPPEQIVVYGVALEVCDRYAVEGDAGARPPLRDRRRGGRRGRPRPRPGGGAARRLAAPGGRVVSTDQILLEVSRGRPPDPRVGP